MVVGRKPKQIPETRAIPNNFISFHSLAAIPNMALPFRSPAKNKRISDNAPSDKF